MSGFNEGIRNFFDCISMKQSFSSTISIDTNFDYFCTDEVSNGWKYSALDELKYTLYVLNSA